MGLVNKVIKNTIALGLAGLVSLNSAKGVSNIEKEKILVEYTLTQFAKCIKDEDVCTAGYFLDVEIHKKLNCKDDRDREYSSSEPWADATHETFKITPINIKVIPYNKNGISYIVYVNSKVDTKCECTSGSCLTTFGKNIKKSGDCPEGGMKDYKISVDYKLLKINNKYYIDEKY